MGRRVRLVGWVLALLVLLAVGARALRLLMMARGAGSLVMLLLRLHFVLAFAGTLLISHYDTPCFTSARKETAAAGFGSSAVCGPPSLRRPRPREFPVPDFGVHRVKRGIGSGPRAGFENHCFCQVHPGTATCCSGGNRLVA